MARERQSNGTPAEAVISIVGPGMKIVGDCETDGTIRIEGTIEGSVHAGKAVVVGRDGFVDGDIFTQDAVISGKVSGSVVAESRLELQASCHIEGRVRARRMQLEEGAILNGMVEMGEAVDGDDQASAARDTTADASAEPSANPDESSAVA